MVPYNTASYYAKKRVGVVVLAAGCSTGVIFIPLDKKLTAQKRVASALAYSSNQLKLLVEDRKLLRLLWLAAKLLVDIAATISPYWLLWQYKPFSSLLANTCSLAWQYSFGCLPLAVKEGCIWVGYIFYSVTIDPLCQVGGGAAYRLFVFADQAVCVSKILLKPFPFCASQLAGGNPIGLMHVYRATVRRVALTLYWICLGVEMSAHLVVCCCIGVVALRLTKKGAALWANLHQTSIQPAVSKTCNWLLVEDRQLPTRGIFAIVLLFVLFGLTCSSNSPSPSSGAASTPDHKSSTILILGS